MKRLASPRKKKTPSTLRRDARRREELLRKKLNAPTAEKAFMCDHCENTFKSENGLKIHIGKSHKKVDSTPATPDRVRQQTNCFVSLSASPLLDTSREESSSISLSVKMPPSQHLPIFATKNQWKLSTVTFVRKYSTVKISLHATKHLVANNNLCARSVVWYLIWKEP